MAKLVDLLAKYLVEWPDGATHAVVDKGYSGKSKVCFTKGGAPEWRDSTGDWTIFGGCPIEVEWLLNSEMDSYGLVAAPHEIVTKSQYLAARDRLHAETLKEMRDPTNADTDQELWDKVAVAAIGGICAHQDTWGAEKPDIATHAASVADAFMTERAKRLKKAQAHEN